MPVRFRCAYCNQLLGIARRKAGTVVRCPTCAGQVIVPPQDIAPDDGGKDPASGNPFVFDRNDFDDLLNANGDSQTATGRKQALGAEVADVVATPVAGPPPGAWGTHAEPAYDVERVAVAPLALNSARPIAMPTGIVLSRPKMAILLIAWATTILVAFAAGLLVANLTRPSSGNGEAALQTNR